MSIWKWAVGALRRTQQRLVWGPVGSPEASRKTQPCEGHRHRPGDQRRSAVSCFLKGSGLNAQVYLLPTYSRTGLEINGAEMSRSSRGAGFSRYFCGPSIIVSGQHWGVLGWAWLKPRMPPVLLRRRKRRREGWLPSTISLLLLLYSCTIWFIGFCSVFSLHYLYSTGGASEFCVFHTSLQLFLWVWGILFSKARLWKRATVEILFYHHKLKSSFVCFSKYWHLSCRGDWAWLCSEK